MTLLQAATGGMGGFSSILLIVLMVIVFYFFIIRPQNKQQKKIAAARAALKVGDKIITAGGIYGVIKELNSANNQVTIEVWEGIKMKVDLNQVFAITEPTTERK